MSDSCNPMGCSPLGSSVHGISQARVLGGMPFPSPGDLPNSGIKPRSPALQADALSSEPPGKPLINTPNMPLIFLVAPSLSPLLTRFSQHSPYMSNPIPGTFFSPFLFSLCTLLTPFHSSHGLQLPGICVCVCV